MLDELLETSEAARLADTSEATIRRAARLGLLPAIRTRRGVRLFKRSDVEAFAKARSEERYRKAATRAEPAGPANAARRQE